VRVLITNNTLADRAGSELYVRDLALGLLKRGHNPVAFSTVLGEVARELRHATIPVIDDLDAMPTPPDIIHGQHNLETMIALLHFTGTPALSFCHGWMPWQEAPPLFPRIFRYVAVDHTCRDRLAFESSIPEDRIRVVLNFVDLDRFKPRGPLPSRPRRALVLSNDANEHTHLPIVREAAELCELALDVIGISSGKATSEPEKVIGDYDIIFARGRSAIEAMAVGAAVVLCGVNSMGSMVTMGEFERLRTLNFGIRTFTEPITADSLVREINRYDATDASLVSNRIRTVAGREDAIEQILLLYREAIDEFVKTKIDHIDELRAASEYLRWLAPRVKESDQLRAALHFAEARTVTLEQELKVGRT